MSSINLIGSTILISLLIIQLSSIDCRPHTKKIIVHGHEWTVPNEEGWDKVLEEAEPYRRKHLTNCASSYECRRAVDQLRQIFLRHPVSSKYYDDSPSFERGSNNDIDSIFKWG